MKKCPVCDYDIKDAGVTVEIDGKKTVVCCKECADKLRKEKRAESAKRRRA